jgi:hypothetical protein
MHSASGNDDGLVCHAVNEPVFVIDPSAPPALELVAERLRLSETGKGRACGVGDQANSSLE